MRGVTACVLGLFLALTQPASGDTLADIRADLSVLRTELDGLRGELTSTRLAIDLPDGAAIDRATTLEKALQRITSQVERLEFRIDRFANTVEPRLTALENRLCALDADCTTASHAAQPVAPNPGPAGPSGVIMTVTEQREFDQAKTMLDDGDPASAVVMFRAFTQAYPGGPITQQAFHLMGTAEVELQNYKEAARAFLSAYSADPDSILAADALFQLSLAFDKLGRTRQACVTLAEVGLRFPSSAAATAALAAMSDLGCS